MEYYVGLDVSLKQTSICVVDQSGSVVREGVVDFTPEPHTRTPRFRDRSPGTNFPRRPDILIANVFAGVDVNPDGH
jgi:hypothetical protein